MLETFHWFRGEGFGPIVDDLLGLLGALGPGPGVIAEGFRRAAFESRGSLLQIAGRTSDPDRALRNLLERDRMFTDRLRGEAGHLGLPVIEVDAAMTEDGLVKRVAEGFGLRG